MAITKIKDSDYANKGIRVKNNPLGLSVSEAQRAFDELSLDVIIPAVNRMAGEIDTTVSELQNKDTTNSTAITKNTADISTNKSDISKNKTDISQNKTDITELKKRVSTTETDISTNKSDISKNKTDISQNKTDITDIKGKVSALQIDISQKAEKDNVLSKDNTEIFVPVENYNPATKKYVDDLISTSGGGDMLKAVYDKQNKGLDIYEYADKRIDNSLTREKILNKINVLDIANGGTGAGTASEALENLGGLPKSDYTAADILAKLKTVDGSGSGLDADLFKGKKTIPVANGGTGASTADMALRYLGGDYIFIRRTTANDSEITESDANTMTKTGVVLTPASGTKNFPDFFSKYNGADTGRKTHICFNVGNPSGYNGYIAFDHSSEEFAMRMGTNKAWRRVLTDKNKPMGTYSGNGNLKSRAINASGFGNVIVVYSQLGIAIVTPNGAVVTENGGTSTYLSSTEAMYFNGTMTLATTNKTLNAAGYTYNYECK
jgi:hypothetical protein